MNHDALKLQLMQDEGYRTAVYRDTLGNLTVGIGHLVLPSDNLHMGDTITPQQVDDFFEHDLLHAEIGCRSIIIGFDQLPEEIQDVCVNMCFNLGVHRLMEFKKFLTALAVRDYATAAEEMQASHWWNEVGGRAERLQAVMLFYANQKQGEDV